MVRTLARHILLSWFIPCARLKAPLAACDDDPSGGDIDDRHGRRVERQHLRRPARGVAHFDEIAGAEIVDGDHGAKRVAGGVDHGKADQIGVVKLVGCVRLGQALARHVELGVGERARRVAVAHAGELRDEMILGRPQRFDHEDAAVLGFERSVAGDRRGIGRERAQPHLAADAMGGADLPEADAARPPSLGAG